MAQHFQALVLVLLVPERSEDQQIWTLSGELIASYVDDLNAMEQWHNDGGLPVPVMEVNEIVDLQVRGAEHTLHGPGMLPQEQLVELAALSGREFDRLFLTLMVQHQEGVLAMAEALVETESAAGRGRTFPVASDILANRRTEIAHLRRMLEERVSGG